ncbi:hypothetical protein CYL18_14295 [Pradoshia eiseniae]|uniref:Uncharacterized protein n=1 Tax=Pradoshia eiseniae TaxID=2064768 RepID=A0A2S7MX33_9BACI|nr:hypothetical protein CYL18_14295 [Pradoshia eiseniae]
MDSFLRKMLHIISAIGTYLVLFGVIFLIQKYTLGILFSLNNKAYLNIPLDVLIFTPSTILLIKQFFEISSPYSSD